MMGARTIDDVHAGSSSVEATAAQPSAAKRCKVTSTPTVITFKAEGSPVQVQLLSSHTLYNLVDVLLQACELVPGEEAYSHMWNVTINGKMYESGDFPCRSDHRAEETTIGEVELQEGSVIMLEYDYGCSSEHEVTVTRVFQHTENDPNKYPCRLPIPKPAGWNPSKPQRLISIRCIRTSTNGHSMTMS